MKFVYSLCLAAAVAGLLQSCSISVINDTPTCAGTAEAHARYGAHRDYEVSAFERVMVKGNFCVHFVQGDQYTLHADGMSAQDLQKLTVKCADGLLQVLDRRERAKTHPEREPLCLTITMPYVVSMEGRGATTLYCPKWQQQQGFSLLVSGAGLCHFGHVAFGDVSIDCSGAADIDLGTMQSSNVQMQVSGAVDAKGQVTTSGRMQSEFSGAANGCFGVKARDISVQASGACYVEMDVACAALSVDGSGACGMVLRGTADSTEFHRNGAVSIDTSHLNEQ